MAEFYADGDEYTVELLPDVHNKKRGWLNRLKLTNSAGKEYTISQRTTTYEWCCGCMAWKMKAEGTRDCKHLRAVGLSNVRNGDDPPQKIIEVIGALRWYAQKAVREAEANAVQ